MHRLPFVDDGFDLIWSEGAAYIMGFDKALSTWRALAGPGGYLVVSELSWFRPDPPGEIVDFWQHHYPAMRGVEENLAVARNAGCTCVGHFPLPADAWDRYHAPLKQRLADFRRSHAHDRDARAVADMTEREISLMERYADFCGYELFVLRRDVWDPPQGSAVC
jgi:SAM-dependent methyltransferase